jgi:RNA polymerase-interacting CarD/CdnL/TRCF family regulator
MESSTVNIVEIGHQVYSPKFGIGKILRKDFIDSASSEFFVVESTLNQTRIMVPVKTSGKHIRQVLSEKEALKAISELENNDTFETQDFPSKKDRVKHFQKVLKSVDLDETINALKYLHNLGDKGKVEQQIFERMLDDLALELSFVMSTNRSQMNDTLHKCLA